jgi:hypothetical protein
MSPREPVVTGEYYVPQRRREMTSLPGDSALPDWAVSQASAALKVGLTVPEIEQQLVAKGLSPSTAAAVVNAVLDGRLRASSAPPGPGDGALAAHRVASAVAVCVCLGLAYAFGGGLSVGRTTLLLLLPVACIWWADALESEYPPALVRWTAWVVLLVIVGYRAVLLML